VEDNSLVNLQGTTRVLSLFVDFSQTLT